MILPIVAFGDPILKKVGKEIDKDYPKLQELIKNMEKTMEHANGVGLAAPQIGLDIRLFIIDSRLMMEEGEEHKGVKETFINATILEETGKEWEFEEGCLSIPDIRENVSRKSNIKIKYFDKDFKEHIKEFDGLTARVIQHEYDHIEGILFTDHLKPLKRKMLKKKLRNISEGKIKIGYRMKFPG
ncbi:MAG: peptide deformylase [Chitinophagales bacterium]|nr:peptide deformylase [Chitinophagales bacterium]